MPTLTIRRRLRSNYVFAQEAPVDEQNAWFSFKDNHLCLALRFPIKDLHAVHEMPGGISVLGYVQIQTLN